MNDLSEKIIGSLLGALGLLVAIIWKSNDNKHEAANKKMDKISDQIHIIESDSVTRDTIIRLENDWRDEIASFKSESRDERREYHRDNISRLDKIESVLSKVVELTVIIADVKVEIGDHANGIRGQLHEQRKQLVKLASKIPNGLEVFD